MKNTCLEVNNLTHCPLDGRGTYYLVANHLDRNNQACVSEDSFRLTTDDLTLGLGA